MLCDQLCACMCVCANGRRVVRDDQRMMNKKSPFRTAMGTIKIKAIRCNINRLAFGSPKQLIDDGNSVVGLLQLLH